MAVDMKVVSFYKYIFIIQHNVLDLFCGKAHWIMTCLHFNVFVFYTKELKQIVFNFCNSEGHNYKSQATTLQIVTGTT